jgi:tRNA pseudouridine13 synthase
MLFSLDFPLAYGPLNASGDFRRLPEDFQVDEVLGYEPSGEGEHVFLHILKRGENTAWVAQAIAQLAGVKEMDVGYCGRKDRHAVTAQWFSVYLPKEPAGLDWAQLNSDSVRVLSVSRHQHKLRRGEHECNQFVIRLRDMAVDDKSLFERKVEQVLAQGVPNYFGEQRFGNGGNNLHQANLLLIDRKPMRDKQKRGLILSAARSYLFNQVLAARVLAQNWQTRVAGESEAFASGPLWGRGRSAASDISLAIEQDVLASWQEWCNALEHQGLQQERRPLCLIPSATGWRWIDKDLELRFTLGGGEFATAVLRELALLRSAEHSADALAEPSI